MNDGQKTHDVRMKPGMSANRLADYMAASEQQRRGIVRACKFRARARVIQHRDARESISEWMSSGYVDESPLRDRAEILRSGLQASEFEAEVAEHNADYIDRYLDVRPTIPSRVQEMQKAGSMPGLDLGGFWLSFSPNLILKRVNRRNIPKIGVAFFRYAKGKPLGEDVARWQGAISFGYLTMKQLEGISPIDPERELCLAIDMWSGQVHTAPTNAIYLFNEVRAVCAGLVERWDQILPPENAII